MVMAMIMVVVMGVVTTISIVLSCAYF